MSNLTDVDLIENSLELAAEQAGDITPDIYERYFAACPGSEALMSHIDHLVRGKMMEEVFRLIMVKNYTEEAQYLDFEVNNHALAYSVLPNMYENLLYALRDSVSHAMGPSWTAAHSDAWDARIDDLVGEIQRRQPAPK